MSAAPHKTSRSRFSHADRVSRTPPRPLAESHAAVADGRTLFRSSVVRAEASPRLLVSGHNNPKIGRRVEKGRWAGMPVYTLTLEERATCARTCHHWRTCMGNSMPFSRRHRHGPEFEDKLGVELMVKNAIHPAGFVVRLHILGDFYSVEYVDLWREWLREFPALRAFGFTARLPGTEIGDAIAALRDAEPERFAMRFSRPASVDGTREAITIWPSQDAGDAITCPAQRHKTAACVTCGLCWSQDRNIAFMAHGNAYLGRPPKAQRPHLPTDVAGYRIERRADAPVPVKVYPPMRARGSR